MKDAQAEVDRYFEGLASDEVEDPTEVQARIMAQILSAPTIDDALNVAKTTAWEELLGVPIEVERVKWQRSTFEGSLNYYAIAFGTRLDSGAPVVASTSAGNVVALLRRAELNGELPVKVKVTQRERATEKGFYPYQIERA